MQKMKDWNLKRVITDVNLKYGAPMGRANTGNRPDSSDSKVYTKHVALNEGYDAGGAYWGMGSPLYVSFSPDLSYIEFNRA